MGPAIFPGLMIFFTRELHEGYQENSGWTRTATARLNRNMKLYEKYFRMIQPFLPSSAVRFASYSFHDSEVFAYRWAESAGKLYLELDTAGTIYPLPKRFAYLTFTGVRTKPPRLPRKKEWWNMSEFHLGSRTRFCLHVMFTDTDVEIAADDVRIRFQDT
jgi:hypothetical protein